MELRIDQEFAEKIPPLTKEEFEQLEANILADGVVINPLIVWNGVIVDGHNRYRIIQMHPEITYQTHEKEFSDRYDAIAWICKNQLGRRNLTPAQRKYLIGKQYEAEKAMRGGKRETQREENGRFTASYQNGNLPSSEKTCERIARENGIARNTVIRDEHFAAGIDAAEEILPGIKDQILMGEIRPSDNAIAAIARASPDGRKELVENLRKPKAAARGQPAADAVDEATDVKNEESEDKIGEGPEPYIPSKASIRQISAAMASDAERPIHETPTAFIIEELTDALDSMIFRWEFCLSEHSNEADDKECRHQIQVLVDKGKAYLKLYRGGKKRDAV